MEKYTCKTVFFFQSRGTSTCKSFFSEARDIGTKKLGESSLPQNYFYKSPLLLSRYVVSFLLPHLRFGPGNQVGVGRTHFLSSSSIFVGGTPYFNLFFPFRLSPSAQAPNFLGDIPAIRILAAGWDGMGYPIPGKSDKEYEGTNSTEQVRKKKYLILRNVGN